MVAYLAAQTGHHCVRINNHQGTDLQACNLLLPPRPALKMRRLRGAICAGASPGGHHLRAALKSAAACRRRDGEGDGWGLLVPLLL